MIAKLEKWLEKNCRDKKRTQAERDELEVTIQQSSPMPTSVSLEETSREGKGKSRNDGKPEKGKGRAKPRRALGKPSRPVRAPREKGSPARPARRARKGNESPEIDPGAEAALPVILEPGRWVPDDRALLDRALREGPDGARAERAARAPRGDPQSVWPQPGP